MDLTSNSEINHYEHVQRLEAEIERLREALKYAIENIQGIMNGTDIPSTAIRDQCLAALGTPNKRLP